MKVLVTGGTGYVGMALRERLVAEGHQVRLLVRPGSAGKLEGEERYEIVYGNVLDTNSCLRACAGVEGVIHLVGIIREFPLRGITFEQMHAVATANMVEAARRQGVERFVHMSALGVGEGARSRYHRTKLAAEERVRAAPMAWTIFRPSVIFAPGSEFISSLVNLVSAPLVPLIDGGRAQMQPVAREDVCHCMTRCLLMPVTHGRIFELGGKDRLSLRRMLAAVAKGMGVRARMVSVPSWVVRPIVKVAEAFPSFPLTSDQLTMLSEDNVCTDTSAEEVFAFEPRSFLNSLPELLAYYRRSSPAVLPSC